MKFSTYSKSMAVSAVLAVLSSAAMVATALPAAAMPISGDAGPAISAPLLQTVADGHRVYPGSESAAAQKARDERNAPNRFCEKQQQYCD